ncbi:M23 family metallopeptidase [Kribbella sp. NPDC056861]|uniref:M23 family metallopeptidase n=1 Tax=Kribbella sp. NPDC056861 TaxID=3154857 RepID=UPI0034477CE4
MAAPVHNADVTCEFGVAGDGGHGFHSGRDYRAAAGTPIRATMAGVVVRVSAGQVVVESNAIWHLYDHLAEPEVRQGDTVETGDRLGAAAGPHLHYEERVTPYGEGDRRNPRFDLHPNAPVHA